MDSRLSRTVLMTAAACLLCVGATSAQGTDASDKVAVVRSLLEQLGETQRLISKEKTSWAVDKEHLQQRIEVMKSQISDLRTKVGDVDKSLSEAKKTQGDLEKEHAELGEVTEVLANKIATQESKTRKLLDRLPPPLRERIEPLSQLIPKKPEDTKLQLGDRFRNVIGVLNDINKFNREIKITNEVRTLGNGRQAEVTVMYVGIGQAYYVTARGDAAGIGTSTDKGWIWKPANGAAEDIQKAIDVYNNKIPAVFVRLPITVKKKGE